MKSFIIFLACVGIVFSMELTEDQKKMLKPHKDACLAEVGIDEATIMEAHKKIEETGKIDFDHNMGCFSSCMLKRLGFFTEEGEVDEDMIIAFGSAQIPMETLEIAVEKCRSITGDDLCDKAIKMLSCYMEHGAAVNP